MGTATNAAYFAHRVRILPLYPLKAPYESAILEGRQGFFPLTLEVHAFIYMERKGVPPVSTYTYDDQLAALERKVTALELQRLCDEQKAKEGMSSAQAFNLREINENITILLGIVSRQEENTRELKKSVDHRFEVVDQRIDTLEQHVNNLFEMQDKSVIECYGYLQS